MFAETRFVFRTIALAASLACLPAPVTRAAEEPPGGDYLLQQWDVDDGLPDDAVAAITQTRDGYLWIGTARGLARFDGVRFRLFTAANTPALVSGSVRFLTEDADGALWIGLSRGGIVRHRTDVFETMSRPTDNPANWPTSLVADSDGSVWLGLPRLRAARWREGQWTQLGEGDGIAGAGAVNCIAGYHGRTWFTTETSCGFFDGSRFITLTTDVPLPQFQPRRDDGCWLARANVLRKFNERGETLLMGQMPWSGGATEIQTLLETRDGVLWIGTKGQGLYRLDDAGIERVPTSHNFVAAIHEDREGNLWVGTGGGLNQLRPRAIRLHDARSGLVGDIVYSICEDNDSALWFGSRSAGALRLVGRRFTSFTGANGWPGGLVTTLCSDRNGGVWFGTLAEGLICWQDDVFRNAGFKGERIESLFQDREGALWIGTSQAGLLLWRDGKVTRFPGKDGLRDVTALAEDGTGHLWAGTQQGDLFCRGDGRFQRFGRDDGLPGAAIQTILADGTDSLWIGTHRGLVRFDGGNFKLITTRHGLPDDDIRQILADDDGNLWFGSSRGLFRAASHELDDVAAGRRATVDCVTYGRSDGLGSFEFTEGGCNAACRARDGRFWFATRRGAVEVNPRALVVSSEPPPVHIEDVIADGKPRSLPASGRVEIPPLPDRIELRYTALSLTAPAKVRFRYRLENVDNDWIEAGAERTATYLHMPPGNYRFHVTACSSEGVWNPDGTSLDFTVRAALWQTGWFRATTLVTLLALLAATIRIAVLHRVRKRLRALERQHALEKERARIAKNMHDDLGARLTRIALLSESARNDAGLAPEAAARAEKISRAAREVSQTLDEIVWTVNPGNDTLERLIGYLSDHATEYLAAAGIRLSQDLPESVPAAPISSDVRHGLLLAVKEALNNAVKHAAATEIKLGIAVEPQSLCVRIADNGCGFDLDAARAAGQGLANMRERLSAVGGSCQIKSESGKGTRVTFTLPLKRE
ncbi:MAG: two-component regulator propeller domain-containing protein [Verrucomicrobiia bacterium]|jgi:ligand-binding sensor domain-containing protein/signal transduction histidine kinase